jgi:hypothetical protein
MTNRTEAGMAEGNRYNAVARLVALWMEDRSPLTAAAGLYKMAVDQRGEGYHAAAVESVAAAEQIIDACGTYRDGQRLDLIATTLAQLDSIEESRRALAEPARDEAA